MQRHTVYLYLYTALQVSGGISTHHQEHTQLYLQHLALVKPLLLLIAIVEQSTEINKLCNVASCWIYISQSGYFGEKLLLYRDLNPAPSNV